MYYFASLFQQIMFFFLYKSFSGSNCVHRFADDKEIRNLEEGDFEDKIQIQIMDNIFNFDLMGIANSIRRLPFINTIGGILMCVINSLKRYEIF